MEKTYGSGEMQLSMIREEWGNDKGEGKRRKHELYLSLSQQTNGFETAHHWFLAQPGPMMRF
jgi:hypothetical protein